MKYKMLFGNHLLEQGYEIAAYPKDSALNPVAWRVLGLGKAERIDRHYSGEITWHINYQVGIVEYDESGVHFFGELKEDVSLGGSYELVMVGHELKIKEREEGGKPDYVTIINKSGHQKSIGFGLGGYLVAFKDTPNDDTLQYTFPHSYYVAAYFGTREGSFIPSNFVLAAVEVKFPDGKNVATLDILEYRGVRKITQPKYSYEGSDYWS